MHLLILLFSFDYSVIQFIYSLCTFICKENTYSVSIYHCPETLMNYHIKSNINICLHISIPIGQSFSFFHLFWKWNHIYIYLAVRMLLWKVDGTWRQNMYLIQLWTLPKTYFSTLNYYISFRMHNVLFKRFESYFLKQNQSSILLLDGSMASNSLICRWGIHSN